MPTHLLFSCLMKGYFAQSKQNPKHKVFYSEKGLFQVNDFGIAEKFKPEWYRETEWEIKTLEAMKG